jgi:hypothetical protein
MKSIAEIGLKIPAATREYYRYTGVSAELERRGAGCSRPELTWAARFPKQQAEMQSVKKSETGKISKLDSEKLS